MLSQGSPGVERQIFSERTPLGRVEILRRDLQGGQLDERRIALAPASGGIFDGRFLVIDELLDQEVERGGLSADASLQRVAKAPVASTLDTSRARAARSQRVLHGTRAEQVRDDAKVLNLEQ